MKNGLNYPEGPMAWENKIGALKIISTLKNIPTYNRTCPDERYMISKELLKKGTSNE